ncbi:MAG: chorismate mutase, partial [Marivirga sp.]
MVSRELQERRHTTKAVGKVKKCSGKSKEKV